jgi:hypothetical protein
MCLKVDLRRGCKVGRQAQTMPMHGSTLDQMNTSPIIQVMSRDLLRKVMK